MHKLVLASALILYRNPEDLRLLMTRRADSMRAFPSAWTFPGGKVDAQDRAQGQGDPDRASQLCALREVFEELGLLLNVPSEQFKALPELREKLLNDSLTFESVLNHLNLQPPLAQLQSIGRRVPPPYALKGFDTTYWLCDVTGLELPEVVLTPENQTWEWVRPRELLKKWRLGEWLVPPPVKDVCLALEKGQLDTDAMQQLLRQSYDESLGYPDPELHPGIVMVPVKTPTLPPATHTNAYIVGYERFFIIDPASPYPEEQQLLAGIIQGRLDKGHEAMGILLTHHHEDHIGGVSHLKLAFQLPVFAHLETAKRVPFKVEHLVKDGESWDLGLDPYSHESWHVEAWHTPGHAPGHLCFVDLRHRVALVGDMVAGIGTILIESPDGHMQTYLDSLARLRDGNLSMMMPAHGPLSSFPKQKCQHYIDHRLMREEKVFTALGTKPLPLNALLPAVYPELDKKLYPLARKSLEAHLEKLCEEKRAFCSAEGYALL